MPEPSKIEALLLQQLQPLEEERAALYQSITRENWGRKVLIMVFLLAGLFATFAYAGQYILVALAIFITLAYLGISSSRKRLQEKHEKMEMAFEQKVKTGAYQAVFKTWNPIASYLPQQFVEGELFEKAGLHTAYTSYKGEDYCRGALADGRGFEFSEVTAHRTVQYFQNGEYSTHQVPVFKGLFFVLSNTLPYAGFDGRVKIQPAILNQESTKEPIPEELLPKVPSFYHADILDADFSEALAQQKKESSKPLPTLFERAYRVEVIHPEEQEALIKEQLPLELTQQLGYLKSFYGQQFSICFDDNKAYFTSRQQLDFLQVPLEHSLISEVRIKHLAKNFNTAFMLLEKMAEVTTIAAS